MIRSNLGAGYALVTVPPDDNPNHGSVIRRAPGSNVVYAHAGDEVRRSPLLVVNEAEPGASWPQDLSATMMFLPDGRLVPQTSAVVDMFRGADGGPTVVYAGRPPATGLRALVPAIGMFAGAAAGYKFAGRHQAWSTVGGALVGGILGLIFR